MQTTQAVSPEPRPAGRPLMSMHWHDLLFVHWRVDAAQVQRALPAGLAPDVFGGGAWVGLVPFTMTRISVRGIGIPGARAFHECNVRTYVTVGGVPGVYFFSLDAASALGVCAAKAFYGLPYFRARIDLKREGRRIDYHVRRRGRPAPASDVSWDVGSAMPPAAPGSLEWFLTERYCLYVADRRGKIRRVRIWHPRWQLREARVRRLDDGLLSAAGLHVEGPPQSVFASDGTVAQAWAWSAAERAKRGRGFVR